MCINTIHRCLHKIHFSPKGYYILGLDFIWKLSYPTKKKMAFKDKFPSPTLYQGYHHNSEIRDEINRNMESRQNRELEGDFVYWMKANLLRNVADKDLALWGKLGANLLKNILLPEIKAETRKQSLQCMVLNVNRKGKEIYKWMM